MKNLYLFIFLFSINLQIAISAERPTTLLKKAINLYQNGSYLETINTLDKLRKKHGFQSQSLYWQGLCYSKLQLFDKSIQKFKDALAWGAPPKDLFYEYAQSLYAMNQLNLMKKFIFTILFLIVLVAKLKLVTHKLFMQSVTNRLVHTFLKFQI